MKYIIPSKLKKGDEIRVIAPSRSLSLVTEETIKLAKEKLEKQGYKVTFSKNCRENKFICITTKATYNDNGNIIGIEILSQDTVNNDNAQYLDIMKKDIVATIKECSPIEISTEKREFKYLFKYAN